MFISTFLLRITHTIISQSIADSSCITLYVGPELKMAGDRADKFGNNTKNVSSNMAVFTVTSVRDLLASVNLNFNG
jgi:hypothetical protein